MRTDGQTSPLYVHVLQTSIITLNISGLHFYTLLKWIFPIVYTMVKYIYMTKKYPCLQMIFPLSVFSLLSL
jgi:hypothetical protein